MLRHPKNNIRSFRFSNDVAKILEDHNYDLESLVLECYYRLPQIEKQSKQISDYNNQLLKERGQLVEDIRDLQRLKSKLQIAESALDNFISNM